jgi:iron complex outermembrane receptor protein
MNRTLHRTPLAVAIALTCIAGPQAAVAQDEEETARLEEVVVTARRREESLQEVPVAVTAVSGTELQNQAAADISDLQGKVPNLTVYAGRNQSSTLTAFMRGIGQADPLWGVDPGVGLYLDDVYIARPQGALLSIVDVGQIEVLRGPQGTLYGKNTIGGAIKYVTKPISEEFEGYVSATVGEYSTQEIRARVSGALGEGVRAKLGVASLQRDGWGENLFLDRDVSDKDTTVFMAGIEVDLNQDWMLRASADYTEDDAEPKGYKRLEPNPLCGLFAIECPILDSRYDVEAGHDPENSAENQGFSVIIDGPLNDQWRFKSITAYREGESVNNIDFDTTPAPITDVFADYDDEQFSQEFQFSYDSGDRWDAVLGLYYFDGEAGGLVRNIFLGSIFGTTDGRTYTESYSVFGEANYQATDRLTLTIGGRYTDEEKRGVAFNAGYADATFSTVTSVTADYDLTEDFPAFLPRLGLKYQFNDDVMGYVSASRGYKSGGFNVRSQALVFGQPEQPFDDEQLDMYEVGLKSTLADGQFLFNAAVYYGDYSDVQISTFTEYDSDGDGQDDAFYGAFTNGSSADLSGFEIESAFNPAGAPWLSLTANISYLDADAEVVDENNDGLPDTQVITNAPEWTGALQANVDFDVRGGSIQGYLGVNYRDDSTLTNEGGGTVPLTQEAHEIWNAGIAYLPTSGQWRAAVNVRNLGDEKYLQTGYNIPVLGIKTGSFGPPETITASFDYNF